MIQMSSGANKYYQIAQIIGLVHGWMEKRIVFLYMETPEQL